MTSLSHLEFDFIWEHLGAGEQPYPLDVPSHGHTMDERAQLRVQVVESLRAKGLHDGQRLSPRLEEQLTLLTNNTVTVDAQLSVGEYVRVLACAQGSAGVLAAQTDAEVRIAPVRDAKIIPAVLAMLPDKHPGPGSAARLPKQAFDEAIEEYQRSGYPALERALMNAGIAGRDLRTLLTLIESPRDGGGQVAANRVDAMGRRSRTPVINWFDTSAGRYLAHTDPTPDRTPWLTITPGDTARIEHRLTALANAL